MKELNQATRVVNKFGGPIRLARLFSALGCEMAVSTIRKWSYSKNKGGTGGYIPQEHWDLIFKAARIDGIIFSSVDLDPRPMLGEPENHQHKTMYHQQAMPIHKHGIELPDDEDNLGGRPWQDGSDSDLLPEDETNSDEPGAKGA